MTTSLKAKLWLTETTVVEQGRGVLQWTSSEGGLNTVSWSPVAPHDFPGIL